MILDDAQGGGQPQSGALARLLGGKEGIENLILDFRRNAGTRVGDANHHMGSRLGFGMRRHIFVVQGAILRCNDKPAAVGHGVAGIDAQVHQHLTELRFVAYDAPQILGDRELDFDRLGKSARNHSLDFLGDVANLQQGMFPVHTAREG